MLKQFPIAVPGAACPRGLYVAPWMGPNDELVLLAITSRGRLAAEPLVIPWGSDSVALAEELEATLDRADPPALRLI